MEFEIKKAFVYLNETDKLNEDNVVLDIYPELAYGKTGGSMSICVRDRSEMMEDRPSITVEINKNQAKYIVGILKAYINEKDEHQ